MTAIPASKNRLTIDVPISDPNDLKRYQNALLALLSKIKIKNIRPEFKEHLKSVYELLGHLQQDDDFLAQHKVLLKEAKKENQKRVKH